MSPFAKAGLTWVAVGCLVAVFFVVRYQMSLGRFQSVENIHPAICRTIAAGLPGVEDFAVDPARELLLISARDRSSTNPKDGLYTLKLTDPAALPVKLALGDMHPGGLDFYRAPDGSDLLSVIDHKPSGAVVETFTVASGEVIKPVPQTTVRGGILTGPADIAAVSPGAFYLANDHVSKGKAGRFAEDYLLWPHADVLAFNGMGFHIAVQRIAAPSGILARTRFMYVTAKGGRRLLAFTREDFTGNLTEIGSLSLPARLDKITMDALGNLIIAGQAKPGTAQVYRVKVDAQGVPQSYETLFSDDGGMLKGASAAAVARGHLFIGSVQDRKILDCVLK